MNLLQISDLCRENLIKYTLEAFSKIPLIKRPVILDAGCGTGVSSLAVIEHTDGLIYAVDKDGESLNLFRQKISDRGFDNRIKIVEGSILEPSLFDFGFDIVIAEGLLNVLGFDEGIKTLLKYSKNGSFLIIHDELRDYSYKKKFFRKNSLSLLYEITIDEKIWLEEYFQCLERKLKLIEDKKRAEKELRIIENQKKETQNLRSVYFILRYHH
ncbi:class I SAM-dependent methyltransferase [candidate division WOR-3 bacterium]|nr:class I SAM-dependent methyltransferase [candidate division WOR-3 bacterium]